VPLLDNKDSYGTVGKIVLSRNYQLSQLANLGYQQAYAHMTIQPETLLKGASRIGGFITFFGAFASIVFFQWSSYRWKQELKRLYIERRQKLKELGLITARLKRAKA
jgi:hypothetical protein